MVAIVAVMLSPYSPFRHIQPLVFDLYQRLHPRPYGNSPVVIVDIDEESIARIGQWPWPRTTMATLTDRLGELGAATVVFDIVFSEPDRTSPARVLGEFSDDIETLLQHGGVDLAALDNDRIFARSIAQTRVVTGALVSSEIKTAPPPPKFGISFGGMNPAEYLPDSGGTLSNLHQFNEFASGVGVINFNPFIDGVVRKIPLLLLSQDQLVPSLTSEALRVAQDASGYLVRSTGASGEADTGPPAMVSIRIGDLVVPTSADGSLWVYYSDGKSIRTLSAHDLLQSETDHGLADTIAGNIVLVGTSAYNLRDQRSTPMHASIAGVTIHAEVLDQIISGVSLSRPDWISGLEFVLLILLGILALIAIPFLPVLINTFWMLFLVAGTAISGWFVFYEFHLLLDPVPAIATILLVFGAASITRLLATERKAKFVRRAFSQYLSPALVDQIARKPDELVLSGETRQLTLLFCDIRNFTGISEGLDPLELTRLLNDFLTPITDVLMRNGATIDKYVGDMVMAFWNAPTDQPDHANLGCQAALEILETMAGMNAGKTTILEAGIGLNTGDCCVGNLGSTQRFNYSAIGDTVNVAARIESLTKQYRITNLITEATASAAPSIRKLEVDRVRVVGRTKHISIYTLVSNSDMDGKSFESFKNKHDQFLAAYYAADLDRARQILSGLLLTAPGSLCGLYSVFSGRLDQLREGEGVAEDWTGIHITPKK